MQRRLIHLLPIRQFFCVKIYYQQAFDFPSFTEPIKNIFSRDGMLDVRGVQMGGVILRGEFCSMHIDLQDFVRLLEYYFEPFDLARILLLLIT